jgi:VWFA-related protein
VLQPVRAAGVYSNDYLAHPPATVNVIFLDMVNIHLDDQAFLEYQLDKLFDQLHPQDQLAIYARSGGDSFLVQDFTSDQTLLRKAVRNVIPWFPVSGLAYSADGELLEQMAFSLAEIPGRKNVLWFSGGSILYLQPAPESVRGVQPASAQLVAFQSLQPVYDLLEADRIAIYPIDVRGLTTAESDSMLEQQRVMSQTAEATGGRAVLNDNGVALNAVAILHEDGNYYTLTYTPDHLVYDNRWHSIVLRTPGKYVTLRYRRGYFADPSTSRNSERARTRLTAGGTTIRELPSAHQPIIFEASVSSSPPARKGRPPLPLTVHFSLPVDAFAVNTVNGKPTVICRAAVYAFNRNGTRVAGRTEQVSFTLTPLAASQPAGRNLFMQVALPPQKSNLYLLLAAWDVGGGQRMGTLRIPYQVPKLEPKVSP